MLKSITIQLVSVAFDPASFYGHHEFDLAIADMFGGFTKEFYDAYHSLIPKEPGFETRHKLYLLFHYLNHWYVAPFPFIGHKLFLSSCLRNHFGMGYRSNAISLIKQLQN